MRTRWMIPVGTVAMQLACAHPAPSNEAASRPVAAAAGSAIQPMKLRYHGEHRGDHPSWIYTAHVSVESESHHGRPAWRRSYRFNTVNPPAGGPDILIEGTTVLDRETMAPLEARSSFGKTRSELSFRSDRVEGTDLTEDGKVSHTTVPVHGFVVTDVWAGLDLYLLELPLKGDFQRRVDVLDGDKLRPFNLLMERIEQIHVPAGDFEAFRIRVEPLDGDERMRSTYHVRTSAPRVVVRKEYVVNPRTEGAMKQSTGIEELEAIEPPAVSDR
jgi:hypothetical protein